MTMYATQLYSEREHNEALEQHNRCYDEMVRVRDTLGRDTDEYRQAHENVLIAAELVRVAARRPHRRRVRWITSHETEACDA